MKKPTLFLIIFLVVLLGFTVFFGLYEVKFFVGRASVVESQFSPDNSYIFVSPLQAKANNQEKIRITVFILNNQGLGVAGKKVIVPSDPSLKIDSIQGLTDSYGKAYFDVSSGKAGEYFLEIKVDNTSLDQTAHLVFN